MSLQTDFAVALFSECKRMMINTAVETQGTTPLANYQKLAPVTDTFLFDIKQIDSNHHKTLFGIGNEGVRRNLEWLVDSGANVIVRMPLIRGYNDSWGKRLPALSTTSRNWPNAAIFAESIYCRTTSLGRKKYERLEMPYPIVEDPSYSVEELDKLGRRFSPSSILIFA